MSAMPAFADIMTLEKAIPPEKLLYLHFGAEPRDEYARLIGLTIAQHPPGRPAPHPLQVPDRPTAHPIARRLTGSPARQSRGGTLSRPCSRGHATTSTREATPASLVLPLRR